MILQDRHIKVSVVAHELGSSAGTVSSIIHSVLMMSKVSSRWVPRMLTPKKKACCQQFSEENLDMPRANPENFFSRIITEDETWGPSSRSRDQTRVHAMETQAVPYSQEILCATISRKDHGNSFFGTQKVFCFWNSCHTRQTLLETPMLPEWWLYARISKRNTLESCRLVSCCFVTMHPHTSHAHCGLL